MRFSHGDPSVCMIGLLSALYFLHTLPDDLCSLSWRNWSACCLVPDILVSYLDGYIYISRSDELYCFDFRKLCASAVRFFQDKGVTVNKRSISFRPALCWCHLLTGRPAIQSIHKRRPCQYRAREYFHRHESLFSECH